MRVSKRTEHLQLRQADKIMRRVKNSFTQLSNTKIESWKVSKKQYPIFINDKVARTRSMYHDFPTLLKATKKYNAGNCIEQALLTLLTFKLNNIHNAKILGLYSFDINNSTYKDLDHYIVGLYTKGKTSPSIIVDTWAGLTCSFEEYLSRCRENTMLYWNLEPNKKIKFFPEKFQYDESQNLLSSLKKNYPELLLKNKLNAYNIHKKSVFENIPYKIARYIVKILLKVKNNKLFN